MKVGDLVKPRYKYSRNESSIGLVTKVEKRFYSKSGYDVRVNRLTIYWAHGETTQDPQTYVEPLNETKNE